MTTLNTKEEIIMTSTLSTEVNIGSNRQRPPDFSVEEGTLGEPITTQNPTKRPRCCKGIFSSFGPPISPAIQFGLRFSFGLMAASLFVLIPYPPGNLEDEYWPQGSWVFTTVVLCSWFPSEPVASSVVQKTYHRILGSTAGALLGLSIGYFTTLFPHQDAIARGLFLGLVTSLVSFLWGWAAVHFKPLVGAYNYAAVLVIMTYGIVVWPFYTSPDGEGYWQRALFRIVNIWIGCVIAGASACLVFPKSTRQAIREKEACQIRRAGASSEAVLQAAMDRFGKEKAPRRISDIVRLKHNLGGEPHEEEEEDFDTAVYDSYTAAVQDKMAVQSLFALLDYDPFHPRMSKRKKKSTQDNMHGSAMNMARSFRIQTTVVLLDSIVRNQQGQRFRQDQLDLFVRAGKLIKAILVPGQPHEGEEAREAAVLELVSLLAQVREGALEAARELQSLSDLSTREGVGASAANGLDLDELIRQLSDQDEGQPLCSQSATILFLQLVEHLILRVLRLYFAGNLRTIKCSSRELPEDQDDNFGIEVGGQDGEADD